MGPEGFSLKKDPGEGFGLRKSLPCRGFSDPILI
jgi:hypothetical protein